MSPRALTSPDTTWIAQSQKHAQTFLVVALVVKVRRGDDDDDDQCPGVWLCLRPGNFSEFNPQGGEIQIFPRGVRALSEAKICLQLQGF